MTIWKNLSAVILFLAFAANAEELRLKDGTVLQGERVQEQDSIVVFKTKLGEVRVPLSEISDFKSGTTASSQTSGSTSVSGQRKNRMSYVSSQSVFSSYTYGPALVSALDLTGTAVGATLFFSVTGSIAAHSIFAYPRSFEDAHIASLNYAATSSFASSYLLSLLMVPNDDDDVFRLGSLFTLGAYPLSLWIGYQHGNDYLDNPGRVSLERAFAWPFALAGGFLPLVYFDETASSETALRIVAAEAFAAGVAGHILSHHYRSGQHIPAGISSGLLSHTLLGAGAGLSIALSGDQNNIRLFTAIVLASATAGFGEGLWFFKDKQDNAERGFFSRLGMLGGATFGGGLLALIQPDDPGVAVGIFTLTSLAGYALTYSLLKDQVETTAYQSHQPNAFIRHVSMNFIPLPEAHRLADNKLEMGYRVPGLTVRF